MKRSSANTMKHILFTGLILIAVIVSALGLTTQPAQASPTYVLDNFNTAAYNNQNGPASWATNWIETNDDGVATSGDVLITGNQLRLNNLVAPAAFESIERSVNMPINATATLTYDYTTAGLAAGDSLVAEIYNGSVWTTLVTYNGTNTTGTQTSDITAYRSSDTRIRFRIVSGYTTATKFFYADNVRISFWSVSTFSPTNVYPYVQIYYLPLPEDQVLTVLSTINADAVSPTTFYASITVIGNNTIIYYDQWEDGYETTINNPTQNTTEVWGDNNPANGMPPGYTTDVLHAGDVITLSNSVNTGNLNLIDFDGGDKLAATQPIAVTRTAWASGSGTLHAGSVEVLDTSVWGLTYDVPAASSVNNYDFSYNGLTVMASQNNTKVYRNGTLVITLNEGQSYLFNNNVALGDRITASAPVQANLLSGDIGSNYESDFFTLYPNELLGSSYYAVVPGFTTSTSGSAVATAVYLYNPGTNSITVHWTTTAGIQPDITVPARGAYRQLMPTTATGAHFFTSTGSVFSAISVVDSGNQRYDWGYTLVPDNQLTQQAKVGWGPGRDPTSGTNPNEDGSPVWFTAVNTNGTSGNISVCVDYNGDNLGAFTDSNGHHYDAVISATQLSMNKVYDPDGDQTGMLLYLCNGSQTDLNNKIAVAWGEDPITASAGAPGLDFGTTVPPLPNFSAVKVAQLITDINHDGLFDVGETFEYQIRINNTGALPIAAWTINAADIVPQYTLYMPGTTKIFSSFTGVTTPISDNTVPPRTTTFPMDEGGYLINEQLKIAQYFVVSFQVKINANIPGSTTIKNQANVSGLNLHYNPAMQIVVQPANENSRIGDRVWLDLNGNGVQDSGEPGIPGITVELHDGLCTPGVTCLTDVTDANGIYGFPNLLNTTYTVAVQTDTLPGGMTLTGDPDSIKDSQTTVVLTDSNKPYLNADFGYQGNVSIGDFVWEDLDHDGVQDGGAEVGIDGVTTNLTWAGPDGDLATTADNLIFSTVTAGGGAYSFNGLPAGTYKVALDNSTLPANYLMTTANPLTLTSLTAGAHYTNADFGAAPGATIGDYVWNDMNGDKIQNITESGLSGVRVYLDSNGNGSFDTGEPSITTDPNGFYNFSGLAAGTYSVRVDPTTVPSGYTLTTANMPLSVTLAAWQNYTTADFGYQSSALSISKISSAGGKVNPGNTITYTLTVRNNSGAQQTGIAINDALPSGATYLNGSTLVNGFMPYYDNFDVATYTNQPAGSATWGSAWTEVNEADGTSAGNLRVVANTAACPHTGNCARITGSSTPLRGLYRQADLSACSAATLSYAYNNTITAGSIRVDLYIGGTFERTLLTYNNTNQANGTASFTLNPAELANNTRVYWNVVSTGTGSTNRIYFDDLELNCTISKDNITGGTNPDLQNQTPPSLVVAGDRFGLDNGQSMKVTYKVTVGNPPYNPITLTSIDNTASVTSITQTTAQQASTSDDILSTIGDFVWNDVNGDGLQGSQEAGISGATVNLRDPISNAILQTTTTGAGGAYSFSTLPGSYVVEFVAPGGYNRSPQDQGGDDAKDSDANVSTGRTATITIAAGVTNTTVDAGFYQMATIGDLVWNDLNGNGIQDSGETGLAGVTVNLRDSTGASVLQTTTTNASGIYSFSAIPGTYIIEFASPSGYNHSPQDQGTDDAKDSDASTSTGRTAVITVTSGQTNNTNDAGFYQPVTISDYVWNDANGDGLQAGEIGLAGVRVFLDSNSNGTYDSSEPNATTNSSGNYAISGLAAGTYSVRVDPSTLPSGYVDTYDLDGKATPNVTSVTLTPGQVRTDVDFGYQQQNAVISDFVWNDANGDGLQTSESGLTGVRVFIDSNANGTYEAGEPNATTNSNGNYAISSVAAGTYSVRVDPTTLPAGYADTYDLDGKATSNVTSVTLTPGQVRTDVDFGYQQQNAVISDYVWNDANGDGSQTGETGLSGVRVFVDSNNDSVYTSGEPNATTNASGNYSIGGLPAGTYSVWVDSTTLPAGYVDTYDLDGKATQNVTSVTLTPGQLRTDVDFGYQQQNAMISGLDWYDANGNGIQDSGETNISGATVNLLDSTGSTILQTTMTASDGTYSFTNLAQGAYTVKFISPVGSGGYFHSPKAQGSDITRDSDADQTSGLTAVLNLAAGGTDPSIDAGFYQAEWGALPATYGTPSTILYPVSGNTPQSVGSQAAIWLGPTVAPASGPASPFPTNKDPAADGISLVNSSNWFEGTKGATIQVTLDSTSTGDNSGYLVVWFDWNHNGLFDPGEAEVNTAVTWTGSSSTKSFTFNVPTGGLSDNLNYRARLFAAMPVDPANAFIGQYANGEVEDYEAPVNTLPVTMNYFSSRQQGNSLVFDWSTGTETGNLGFNLYLKTAQGLQKLNSALIPSTGFTTHDPQDYHLTLKAGVASNLAKFYLEDVDNIGRSYLHGPFQLNQTIGKRITGTLTDWQTIRAQNDRILAGMSADNSRSVNEALRGRKLAAPLTVISVFASGPTKTPTLKTTRTLTSTATTKPPTRTPTAKPPTRTPTTRPSVTPKTSSTATFSPSATPLPTQTSTDTALPTQTSTDTALPTETLLPTSNPSPNFTPTLEPSATATMEPSATETPEPAATSTLAPSVTDTLEPTTTDTPAPAASDTLQPSATDTQAPVVTDTVEPTMTDTVAPTSTATLEPSPTATLPPLAPAVKIGDLLINQTGIYRLTYENLLAAGLDLTGQPAADLAVTMNGVPVQIIVSSPDNFGPGSYIEFFGRALTSLYTDSNVYSLWVDHSSAQRVNLDQSIPDTSVQPVSYYMETALLNNNKGYDELSTTGDPWYNARMLVYTKAKSWNYPISVDHYLPAAAPASLLLDVYGGTNYPTSPDHHVIASFNAVQVASRFFDALNTNIIQAALPAGNLKEGSNSLTINLPGDTGQPADVVYLDQYSVSYPRSFWALNGRLTFTSSGQVFQVDNLTDPAVVVYRLQNGSLTKLNGVVVTAQGSAYRARFNGNDQPAVYYVSSAGALSVPGIRAARPFTDIKSGTAQYLIISHPSFIAGLGPLVQARIAQGLTVRVVDVFDIYDQFSYGILDPMAIKNYIAYAANHMGTKYVLLVGDDTYDYKNYLKIGSISFIPSIYMAAGDLVQYAPVDPKYADINDDNVPDLAIGRFAVRTPAELSNVITKTLAYAAKTYGKTSLFAADSGYTNASDALLAKVPSDWVNSRAYLDTLGVTQAHNALIASLNAGTALTSFDGHTDDWEWTFNGLFTIYDAAALTNSGSPTVVTQNGCWNNYYVNPRYETMGDAMINDGSYGAAAMIGSTTLTLDLDEQKLGSYFMPQLTRPGMTIGQAMLEAKQTLAATDPQAIDVLMGWTLLGDPYLGVTP